MVFDFLYVFNNNSLSFVVCLCHSSFVVWCCVRVYLRLSFLALIQCFSSSLFLSVFGGQYLQLYEGK